MGFKHLLAVFPWLLNTGYTATIFVSHYQGTVSSLNFIANSNGTYSLTPNSTVTIGGQPSWITWDSTNRIVYAADETSFGSGSITSISAAQNEVLKELARPAAPGGAVANVIYGNGSYIASAH